MRLNTNLAEPIAKWNSRLSHAKTNYKTELLQKEYSAIMQDIKGYKASLQRRGEEALQQIKDELAAIEKPADPKRNLDANTVTTLNYCAKIIQSKLASAGNQKGFLEVLEDIVHYGDENMRWALVDSYHDILKAGMELAKRTNVEGFTPSSERPEVFESLISEQIGLTKDSFKSPDQLAKEQEAGALKSTLENEHFQTTLHLSMANDALQGTLANYQRDYLMNIDD